MIPESRFRLTAATGFPAFVVIVAAMLSTAALRDSVRSRVHVERTYRVLSVTDAMLSRVIEAEAGVRGYLITGDRVYLAPVTYAGRDVNGRVRELRVLITDRPQRERLDALVPVMESRLAMMRDNAELRRRGPLPLAEFERRLGDGKVLTDEIRRRVAEMQRAERALLRARSATAALRTRIAFVVLVVGAVVSAVSAVLANLLFARHAAERTRAAAELRTKNQELQEVATALRESEQRFRSLIENSTDMITVIGRDGTVRYQSRNVERVLGYPLSALVGKSALFLVHAQDRAVVRGALLNELISNPAATPTLEYRVRHVDGSWRTVESTASNLLQDLSVRGLVLNSRDLTERRRAEAELRKSEELLRQAAKMEAVGRLAGGIAHDFNNLLTVIGGNAMLLEAEHHTAAGQDSLAQIRRATDRAASLTRQLLVFSRRSPVEPRVVRPNEVVREVTGMLRRLVSEKIAIHLSLGEDAGAVRIDPAQLEQVIVNLTVNASDAMPGGGDLTIETRSVRIDGAPGLPDPRGSQTGRAVRLCVSDTGIGMDEETQARVFEPFFTTKGLGKGTGLGLSTVYGIVQQNGGTVSLRSAPGRGTTFTVDLPEVEDHQNVGGSRTVAVPAQAHHGSGTILLVEDEPGVRSLVYRILRKTGYTVLAADSPESAMARVQSHAGPIHLLLTDVVMPGGSGTTLAAALQPMWPGLPVLYMSGHTDEAISKDGILQPGVAFVQKPFAPEDLLRLIRELIDAEPKGGHSL